MIHLRGKYRVPVITSVWLLFNLPFVNFFLIYGFIHFRNGLVEVCMNVILLVVFNVLSISRIFSLSRRQWFVATFLEECIRVVDLYSKSLLLPDINIPYVNITETRYSKIFRSMKMKYSSGDGKVKFIDIGVNGYCEYCEIADFIQNRKSLSGNARDKE